VVGPEAPLAEGIVDRFEGIGIPIFGPSQAAAEIESSKVFAKQLMMNHGIPCAGGAIFIEYEKAKRYLEQVSLPVVIKADGLASGKGVTVANSTTEAMEAIHRIMKERVFGSAGDRIIIEEYLAGNEMSSFAFTDGKSVVRAISACDYKPALDGNKGPNTGGMGSYTPPKFANSRLYREITEKILKPTVLAMAEEKRPYRGLLYGGLMVTEGGPKVMEFNARFGDPETQVVLPLLKTDLLDILMATTSGNMDKVDIEWEHEACVGVVMASGGYPGNYKTGFPVSGLENLDRDLMVFHAGTKLNSHGEITTSGGRVLTLVATGKNIAEARSKVYENIPRIHFKECQYRKDIAFV